MQMAANHSLPTATPFTSFNTRVAPLVALEAAAAGSADLHQVAGCKV